MRILLASGTLLTFAVDAKLVGQTNARLRLAVILERGQEEGCLLGRLGSLFRLVASLDDLEI